MLFLSQAIFPLKEFIDILKNNFIMKEMLLRSNRGHGAKEMGMLYSWGILGNKKYVQKMKFLYFNLDCSLVTGTDILELLINLSVYTRAVQNVPGLVSANGKVKDWGQIFWEVTTL